MTHRYGECDETGEAVCLISSRSPDFESRDRMAGVMWFSSLPASMQLSNPSHPSAALRCIQRHPEVLARRFHLLAKAEFWDSAEKIAEEIIERMPAVGKRRFETALGLVGRG